MALDQQTLEAQLTLLDAAINAALANPTGSWAVGNVRFSQQEYLSNLFDQKKKLIDMMRAIPSEGSYAYGSDVDTLGHDIGAYRGNGWTID